MEPINPLHYQASRAAAVVQHNINYQMGTPYRLYERQQVTSASKEIIAGEGNKYYLTFSIKDIVNEKPEIMCTAAVLYYIDENSPPDVKFTLKTMPENYTANKDQEFYTKMKNKKNPLVAENIPDKFGNVAPDMEPVRNLCIAAAGFVKWKYSTENTLFAMTVIDKVEQKMTDDALEFLYNVRFHEMVTQEMIPWQIEFTWNPSKGLKIKDQKRLPKRNEEAN